jgi:hypothetical protein
MNEKDARNDPLFLAQNIINQIGDLWHERIPSPLWVPVRQSTNDELDAWVSGLLREALAVARVSTDAEAKASALEEASNFSTSADVVFHDLGDVRDWLRDRAAAIREQAK